MSPATAVLWIMCTTRWVATASHWRSRERRMASQSRRFSQCRGPSGIVRKMSADMDSEKNAGPWNPGVLSQMPKDLRPLATIFRPENVFTSVAAADELQGLTGFALNELVVFRPQRLALHELLIRVTADFAVPDGSQIGDLGINFRRMASRILTRYLEPEMDTITRAYDQARRRLTDAVAAALADAVPGLAPTVAPPPPAPKPRRRLLSLVKPRRPPAAVPLVDREWGPAQIADCERRASAATDELHAAGAALAGPRLGGIVCRSRTCLGYTRTHRLAGKGPRLQLLRQRRRRRNDRTDFAAGRPRRKVMACCRIRPGRSSSIPKGPPPPARARCARCRGNSPARSVCAGAISP